MRKDRKFSLEEIVAILDAAMGKTLGEVDVNHVFDRTIDHPKITGIAGDVVEQSVLGFDPDNLAEPDIDVDGVLIELALIEKHYILNEIVEGISSFALQNYDEIK